MPPTTVQFFAMTPSVSVAQEGNAILVRLAPGPGEVSKSGKGMNVAMTGGLQTMPVALPDGRVAKLSVILWVPAEK